MELIQNTSEYKKWIEKLKSEIQKSQIKAAISVNQKLLDLYWRIGKSISEKINQGNWGMSVVENASKDLRNHFPNQQGFSRSNLFSMRKWYEFYANSELDIEKVQQLVGLFPWAHNVLIVVSVNNLSLSNPLQLLCISTGNCPQSATILIPTVIYK